MKKSITRKLAFAGFGVFWFFVLYAFIGWIIPDEQEHEKKVVEETTAEVHSLCRVSW